MTSARGLASVTLWVQAGLGGIGDHNRHRHVDPEALLKCCHQSIFNLVNDQRYTIVRCSQQESGLIVTVTNFMPAVVVSEPFLVDTHYW